MTIPIALLMGFYMRHIRPGRILEMSLIGVSLLLLCVLLGGYVNHHPGLHVARNGTDRLKSQSFIRGGKLDRLGSAGRDQTGRDPQSRDHVVVSDAPHVFKG